MSDANETLTIDPVKEGIVNRIAAGTIYKGDLACSGGLWVEGTVLGSLEVDGVLVLSPGSKVRGKIIVRGPLAVLAGQVLQVGDTELSEIQVAGIAHLASSLDAKANIMAGELRFYTGAQIEGRIRTGTASEVAPLQQSGSAV